MGWVAWWRVHARWSWRCRRLNSQGRVTVGRRTRRCYRRVLGVRPWEPIALLRQCTSAHAELERPTCR
jgi:hypothetical protein